MKLKTNNQRLIDECIRQEMEETETFNNIYKFFEYFASSIVFKNYDFSDDEIMEGITGGGDDGGIDGIYILYNQEIITEDQLDSLQPLHGSSIELKIIQAKYESSFKEESFIKWKDISQKLLSFDSLKKYNSQYAEKIIDSFSLFSRIIKKFIRYKPTIKIQYDYVTLGLTSEIHPKVIEQQNELKETIKAILPSANISVDFWGADELFDVYNSSPDLSINLAFAEQPISLGSTDIIALVNLQTYFKFITDKSGNICTRYFDANVRDYQGNNSVNKSIATTLRESKDEDFWWFNNGVTILASGLKLYTSKEIVIENPTIVNGLQTSREIYNYYKEHPETLSNEKRHLLVRIIKPSNDESRDRIIFATNNQTSIPKYSLRVTDNIHIQIELYFKNKGLYYDRRKNYYKNFGKKASEIIGVAFLAQCLISLVLKKPDFARARPSSLLADESIYNQLYDKNIDLEAYYKAAMIGKRIKNSTNLNQYSQSEKNDILFYVIYVVVAFITKKYDISFSDLKDFDLSLLTDDIINYSIELVYNLYVEQGASGSIAKSPSFINHVEQAMRDTQMMDIL